MIAYYTVRTPLFIQELAEEGSEVSSEEEDAWYLRRLDGGLFTLQTVDYILAWIAMEDDGVCAIYALPRTMLTSLLLDSNTCCPDAGSEESIPPRCGQNIADLPRQRGRHLRGARRGRRRTCTFSERNPTGSHRCLRHECRMTVHKIVCVTSPLTPGKNTIAG